MSDVDYKIVILSRYCGEYLPADEKTSNVKKTSQDIIMDLRPMATFTTDEIAAYLATNGYVIGFDEDSPVWLMKSDQKKELQEH